MQIADSACGLRMLNWFEFGLDLIGGPALKCISLITLEFFRKVVWQICNREKSGVCFAHMDNAGFLLPQVCSKRLCHFLPSVVGIWFGPSAFRTYSQAKIRSASGSSEQGNVIAESWQKRLLRI